MAAQTNYTLLETDEYEFDPEMGSMDTPSIAETQFKSGVLEVSFIIVIHVTRDERRVRI